MTRKHFLNQAVFATGGFAIVPAFGTKTPIFKGALPPELVKEFVGVSHGNFDKTKALLEETPNLLNATWDWGDGDFETGIGAAGHTGSIDIANLLLEKGARADIFVLTMLGKTEIVKAMLESFPALLRSPGPHGLSLLHHAEKGGERSQELYDFFQSKGLTEKSFKVFDRS